MQREGQRKMERLEEDMLSGFLNPSQDLACNWN